jgi:hypothetical protein
MTRITRRIGLVLLAALFFAPAAFAQGNTGQQQPAPPPNVEVTDAELATVANVFLEIRQLQQSFAQRAQQAENQQETMQLRQQFQQEVAQTIEAEEEITQQRFTTIMRAAQADSTLAQRISTAVQSAAQAQQGDSTGNNGSEEGDNQ